MNLQEYVFVLLLVAVSHGATDTVNSKQSKEESSNTEKRALVDGNAGVEKRAPVLANVSPTSSPGVVYADATESHSEKSPTQIYATPVPQLVKISDVLTGQGPPFPVAITSHLFSPVSAYQPRFAAPTTYQISAPIPSQLPYTEHKIAYPAPQNVLQYNLQRPIQQSPNYQDPRQTDPRITFNYQQLIPQSTLVQSPSVVRLYSQHQDQIQARPGLPQIGYQFQFPAQNLPHPIYYTQPSQVDPRNQIQHPFVYSQGNIVPQVQPGITYAIQEKTAPGIVQRPEKRVTATQQHQNGKPQGAISYASFSQSLPSSQPAQHQYNGQQYIPVKMEPAANIASLPVRALSSNPHREISYFRPGPLLPPLQPHFIQQPQFYSQPPAQNPAYHPQSLPIAPVQYYGKYSQPVFG